MNPTLTTFLFEMANFLVLAAALGWLFFKPVRQALMDYRTKLEADNELAAQKLAEADKVHQQMSDARSHLQAELAERRASELAELRQQAERIVADARSTAEREREMSQHQAAHVLESQRDALAEVSAAAAAEMVTRLLDQIDGPELQTALIASACRQLAGFSAEALTPIKVESGQPLTAEQTAMVRKALGGLAGNVDLNSVDFRILADLGAGIRITTGKGLIDASVSGLAQFARQTLAKEMGHLANNHHPMQSVHDD